MGHVPDTNKYNTIQFQVGGMLKVTIWANFASRAMCDEQRFNNNMERHRLTDSRLDDVSEHLCAHEAKKYQNTRKVQKFLILCKIEISSYFSAVALQSKEYLNTVTYNTSVLLGIKN